MKKLAIFSPLPPIKSGIAYYSYDLAKELLKKYKITFFVDKDLEVDPEISKQFNIVKVLDQDDILSQLSEFDTVLYQFGNNAYHGYMYDIALKYPGLVVLHDLTLHHLVAYLTLDKGDSDEYVKKVSTYYPEYLSEVISGLENKFAPNYFDYPFNDEIVESSLAVIVHNNFSKKSLEKKFPKSVFEIPLFFDKSYEVKKISTDEINITCFGFITPPKRTGVVLSVFSELVKEFDNIKLNLVGELAEEMTKLRKFIDDNDLNDKVNLTGFCSSEEFSDYLAKSDICVNLRYPSAGETSATLVDALGNGIPTIVSKYDQFDEYPDDVVLKVPVDKNEKKYLYSYLNLLISNTDLRALLGSNSKKFIECNSSLEKVAEEYSKIIDDCSSGNFILAEKILGVGKDVFTEEIQSVIDELLI